LRVDYDTTTTRLRRKIDMFIFCSRRIVSNGSRHAIRCSRIVVVSQSNRTHIVISITSVVVDCVVVSSYTTYRSLVVVESQKNDMFIFCSRRIASNGSRRARYVVVESYSYRNCNHGLICNHGLMLWLQLRFDYDTTTIRLHTHLYSPWTADNDVSRAPASNSTQEKKWTCQFFVVVVS